MNLYLLFIKSVSLPTFLIDKLLCFCYKKCMKSCGKHVYIRPLSSNFKGLSNLTIGNYCIIPKQSTFFCTDASLTIGNNVIFGPSPTIITGDHRINEIGKFIINSHNKLPQNDKPVIIEDDVWCGANITILKGVTIGRGCIVAAGAVVVSSTPPYSIVGGIPAKILNYRFTRQEVIKHEEKLYPKEQRLTEKELEHLK